MTITKRPFGRLPDGEEVWLYELDAGAGLRVECLSYGALIKAIHLDDGAGNTPNLVLGYDGLSSYVSDTAYLGATIGRYCNRIAKSRFPLDGTTVHVVANEGLNQLHGGPSGFNQRVWSLINTEDAVQPSLTFEYISPAGEQGFPGNVRATVSYRLTQDNALWIEFSAQTDAATVVNLTNHSYFNLHGDCNRTVLDHQVQISADHYLPVDESFVPSGEIQLVANTPFDLRDPVAIGSRLNVDSEQIRLACGFDHNWVLDNQTGELREVASAKSLHSGIGLTLSTTQPGLQFYTGNQLQAAGFKKHAAFCFETQHFPNAPNQPNFPSTILRPGETYSQTTVYAFAVSQNQQRVLPAA